MSEHTLQQARFPKGMGLAGGQPDLWCTYAAIRTLVWVGRVDNVDTPRLHEYIQSRRNRDGGYAWSKGMPSDAWATFYCTETLKDLGISINRTEDTAAWIHTLFDGNAYAMCPGQTADAWATHFAVRTLIEVCQGKVINIDALYAWLERLQCHNGGLSWSADFAQRNVADVRACFYGIMAARALGQLGMRVPAWDVSRLIAWLQAQQMGCGGFRFNESAQQTCLWATFRATSSLAELQSQPLDRRLCAEWIMSLRGPTGGFVRWEGYNAEDVWAAFSAIGALKAISEPVDHLAKSVEGFIASLAMPQGGYTYRRVEDAADVLTTAAGVLGGRLQGSERDDAVRWIEGCQMPNEAGIMYMPGRGAEVRCTAWGLATGVFVNNPKSLAAIGQWVASLQNPDGGFGFWEGRGSDMVSTASAVSILEQLGHSAEVDLKKLEDFVTSCCCKGNADVVAYGNYPRGQASLRSGLQALSCLNYLKHDVRHAAANLLDSHKVRQGGFANHGKRIPDLLSTYEAIAISVALGLHVDLPHMCYFLEKVRSSKGYAWSPLFLEGQDALSICLGQLLEAFAEGKVQQLPNLHLS